MRGAAAEVARLLRSAEGDREPHREPARAGLGGAAAPVQRELRRALPAADAPDGGLWAETPRAREAGEERVNNGAFGLHLPLKKGWFCEASAKPRPARLLVFAAAQRKVLKGLVSKGERCAHLIASFLAKGECMIVIIYYYYYC